MSESGDRDEAVTQARLFLRAMDSDIIESSTKTIRLCKEQLEGLQKIKVERDTYKTGILYRLGRLLD